MNDSDPHALPDAPPAPASEPTPAGKSKRGPLGSAVELVLTIAAAIGLALIIQALLVKPYRIPSGSMIPTLSISQRILVNRLGTHPGIGAVVVFHPPVGADDAADPQCGDPATGAGHQAACDKPLPRASSQTFVKRVVGLPGDHIAIVDGRVYRNGRREPLPYSSAQAQAAAAYVSCGGGGPDCTFPRTITVPAGDYFMMGDNRGDSDDSRFWGPVPQKWIIGEVFFTYWPIGRVGFL